MKSKRPQKSAAEPTQKQFAAARQQLRDIIDLLMDLPLGLDASILVQFILEEILAGVDVRKRFGIAPKNGKPSEVDITKMLAIHYWALRLSGEKNLTARNIVANQWGTSESWVYQSARKHRASATRPSKYTDYGETIRYCEGHAEMKRHNELTGDYLAMQYTLIDANRTADKGK
jgi:hypothetical protein